MMITPVLPYIKAFIDVGADIISFHPEADDNPNTIIETIKNANCKAGIAIHPKVKIKEIQEFLNDIDLVVVMTVVPGFSGQKFLDTELYKINQLYNIRESTKANFEIEIDGGINPQTSKQCIANGADVLVAGSYIYGADESEYGNLINSLR